MQKLARLLPALLFFAFILFFPAETRADPLVITGDTVFIGGAVNSRNAWRAFSINFSGQNVHVSVSAGDSDSRRSPQTSCASGPCAPGTLVSPNSSFVAEGVGAATVNGVTYSAWFNALDTGLTFTGESVLFPGDTNDASTITLTTNFSMTGTLVIHDLNASGFPIVFTGPITGQGTAYLLFTRLSTGYWLTRVTYEFVETPEPATLLLLGTGLAGAAAYKRRRRKAAR